MRLPTLGIKIGVRTGSPTELNAFIIVNCVYESGDEKSVTLRGFKKITIRDCGPLCNILSVQIQFKYHNSCCIL